MAVSCGSMKKGQIYKCQDCSFEIEVIEECDCDKDEACQEGQDQCCNFTCCGKEMVRK